MRSRNALVLLTLLAAVPVLAAEEPTRTAARPLATLHSTLDTMSWEVPAGFGEIELTVAGPDGVVVRRQFAGETPTFDLFDERGERRPDGVYTYELRAPRALRPGRSLLLSGSLAIRDGSFVDPEVLSERPRMGPRPIFKADTVINDDLIVKGSTCLGFECTDGTAGLELVVKSSSPDITFEDTGGGISGTHDWMILINGAFLEESFKIFDVDSNTRPFTLTGGAPDHSLFVSSAGKVGLGTSTPGANLHVFGSATADVFGSMGPDPLGATAFNVGYGGLSFGRGAAFLNSKDTGATAPNPSIRFLINTSTKMIIDNEGFIGLGVANPTSPIHHSSGAILTAGGTWQNASSRDLKRDIASLAADEAITTLQGLEPVKFAYKVDPEERHVGFIAEDVPDLVAAPDRKSLSSMDIIAVLTKVAQEREKTISELQARLAKVEAALEAASLKP